MYNLVKIVWLDIIRPEETWLFLSDAKLLEPAAITTVGWIIDERETSLVISSSLGDDNQLGDINCIPKCVIKSIEYLEEINYENDSDTVDIPIA